MSCENKGCASKDFTLCRTFAERFHIKMMKSYIILQFRENGSVAQCANYENLLLRVFSLQKFRENICINANSKGTLFSRNFFQVRVKASFIYIHTLWLPIVIMFN